MLILVVVVEVTFPDDRPKAFSRFLYPFLFLRCGRVLRKAAIKLCKCWYGHAHLKMAAAPSSKKVEEYEAFFNERLAVDLEKTLAERDKIYEEIAEYNQLKNFIENTPEAGPMKTMVDIGCNFYMRAKAKDPSHISVLVGLDVYLFMTRPEALRFITIRNKHLYDKVAILSSKASDIRARMTLVLEGLREIQGLPAEEKEKPQREVW